MALYDQMKTVDPKKYSTHNKKIKLTNSVAMFQHFQASMQHNNKTACAYKLWKCNSRARSIVCLRMDTYSFSSQYVFHLLPPLFDPLSVSPGIICHFHDSYVESIRVHNPMDHNIYQDYTSSFSDESLYWWMLCL